MEKSCCAKKAVTEKNPVQNITQLCDLLDSVIWNTTLIAKDEGTSTGSSALGHLQAELWSSTHP